MSSEGIGTGYGGDLDRFLSDLADGLAHLGYLWPDMREQALALHGRVAVLLDEPECVCGDCGDRLYRPNGFLRHTDDRSPACHSRKMADARRARQGRPAVGG